MGNNVNGADSPMPPNSNGVDAATANNEAEAAETNVEIEQNAEAAQENNDG